MFVLWFLLSIALGIAIGLIPLIRGNAPPSEVSRYSLVGFSVIINLLPTGWATESVSTLRAMMEAGLEHPKIAQMKIDYFRRYGKEGGNPVARRWAVAYFIVYLAWIPMGIWFLPWVGLDGLPLFVIVAVFIFGLISLVSWGAYRYYRAAESRGYPLIAVATELRSRGLRY